LNKLTVAHDKVAVGQDLVPALNHVTLTIHILFEKEEEEEEEEEEGGTQRR
jgi:hypothetical protein